MSNVDDQYADLRRSVATLHGEAVAAELDHVFAIADQVHRGQRRMSGDPYITHPIEVASYVNAWGLSATVVKAALAHDIADSTDIRDYEEALGPTVTAYIRAVKALDVLGDIHQLGDLDLDFDRNAAVIKIADRLHNARTWEFIPQQRAKAKARYTLALFAPAAAALDLTAVAEELRALSTATLAQQTNGEVQRVRGTAAALLAGALRMLPAEQYERYRGEWLADLAQLESRRERAALATGLIYSAWAIRRQNRRPS